MSSWPHLSIGYSRQIKNLKFFPEESFTPNLESKIKWTFYVLSETKLWVLLRNQLSNVPSSEETKKSRKDETYFNLKKKMKHLYFYSKTEIWGGGKNVNDSSQLSGSKWPWALIHAGRSLSPRSHFPGLPFSSEKVKSENRGATPGYSPADRHTKQCAILWNIWSSTHNKPRKHLSHVSGWLCP